MELPVNRRGHACIKLNISEAVSAMIYQCYGASQLYVCIVKRLRWSSFFNWEPSLCVCVSCQLISCSPQIAVLFMLCNALRARALSGRKYKRTKCDSCQFSTRASNWNCSLMTVYALVGLGWSGLRIEAEWEYKQRSEARWANRAAAWW